MNWTSIPDFLAMGGYGLYVWGAFGITALLLAAEMLTLHLRRRALRAAPEPFEPVAAHVVDYHAAPASHGRSYGAAHEA